MKEAKETSKARRCKSSKIVEARPRSGPPAALATPKVVLESVELLRR